MILRTRNIRSSLKVELDYEFMFGNRGPGNDVYFVDYPQMTKEEKRTMHFLVWQVLNTVPVEGRNKTSYSDAYGNLYPGAEIYRAFNYWHVHSGLWNVFLKQPVFMNAGISHPTSIDLNLNFAGKTSGPAIHYMKKNNNIIRVVAFSPRHHLFMRGNNPNNTQLSRMKPSI